jgi:GDPmannose 4,6-dehydratase
MKKALITGINGQDGSYLAELLLSKGYEVHGIVRHVTTDGGENKLHNINHILDKVHLHVAFIDDVLSIAKIVNSIMPDECFHMAASSFVSYSFENEISVFNNNVNSTHSILSAIKEYCPHCKIYFAGSSEMFGRVSQEPQTELTPFNPRSIYGISKVTGYYLAKNYREKYGMFICTGILYNHESPRRGFEFVTRKITSSVAKIKLGLQRELYLGNLDALRDWGYAPDYVKAMWLMLQQENPDDYVIASGTSHSVREFVEFAFLCVDLDYREYVKFDKRFYREAENIILRGDSSKARERLNWRSTKSLNEIINKMVLYDLEYFSGGSR